MSEQSRPQGELPELLSSRTAESAVLDRASTGVGLGSSGFTCMCSAARRLHRDTSIRVYIEFKN